LLLCCKPSLCAHLDVSQLLFPRELLRLLAAAAAHLEAPAWPASCSTTLGDRLTTTAHEKNGGKMSRVSSRQQQGTLHEDSECGRI
jgi:hypothetical protein